MTIYPPRLTDIIMILEFEKKTKYLEHNSDSCDL